MSKEDILRELNLKPTSYVTYFGEWARKHIILRKGGKCHLQDVNDWIEK